MEPHGAHALPHSFILHLPKAITTYKQSNVVCMCALLLSTTSCSKYVASVVTQCIWAPLGIPVSVYATDARRAEP
jgi:hypothetical protein